VPSDVGRLLAWLVRTTAGRLTLEIGTLGGYSTLWLLEGMGPSGRIITIELVDKHAEFAEGQFASLGVGDRIDVRRGPALELLPGIADEVGPESVDVVFIDADKLSYTAYYEATAGLVVPGGLLIVDNVFGTSSTWIDDLTDPGIAATDRMNRMVAADDRFDTAGVAVRQGVLVARRRQS
jgi:predicted O-methyltransferase YrrM